MQDDEVFRESSNPNIQKEFKELFLPMQPDAKNVLPGNRTQTKELYGDYDVILSRQSRELAAKEHGFSYIDHNVALYLKPNLDNTAGTRFLLLIFLIDWLYSLVFVVFQVYLLYFLSVGEFGN